VKKSGDVGVDLAAFVIYDTSPSVFNSPSSIYQLSIIKGIGSYHTNC